MQAHVLLLFERWETNVLLLWPVYKPTSTQTNSGHAMLATRFLVGFFDVFVIARGVDSLSGGLILVVISHKKSGRASHDAIQRPSRFTQILLLAFSLDAYLSSAQWPGMYLTDALSRHCTLSLDSCLYQSTPYAFAAT